MKKLKHRALIFSHFIGRKALVWFAIGLVSSIVQVGVEYGLAIFLQLFMVNIGVMQTTSIPAILQGLTRITTSGLCLFLIAIGIVRCFSLFFSIQSSNVFSEILNARLRLVTIYELLLKIDQKFIPASEISTRFGELFPKAGYFIYNFSSALISFIQILFLFLGMLWAAPHETAIGVFGLLLVGLPVRAFTKKVLAFSESIPAEQSHINMTIERVTRNWLFVRIAGTQKLEYENLAERILSYFNNATIARFYVSIASTLPPLAGIMLLSAIIYLSTKVFQTPASSLLAFLFLFVRLVQQISSFVTLIGGTISYLPHFRQSLEIFRGLDTHELRQALHPEESLQTFSKKKEKFALPREGNSTSIDVSQQIREAPEISIHSLCFRWTDDTPMIFNGFSLTVPPYSSLGIEGPSGVGKSTLLALILGIIKPTSGEITLQGRSASTYLREKAGKIGYVGADPFLFRGTLYENLIYGNRSLQRMSEARIFESLRIARIDQFVQGLPGGLQFKINENGDGLSTGQKQRLAIARALLLEPCLLILDEASANLDFQTEAEIAESIPDLARVATIIIVSHRPGLLKHVKRKINLLDRVVTG